MKKTILFILSFALVLVALAHEYILLAEKYRLTKGDDLILHLFVADGYNIQLERPFQNAPTRSFELITPDGITDLSKTDDGKMPVVKRKADFDGGGLIHLERDYARITLTTPKFLDYLREDHIENVPALVDKTKTEQKERYTRYLKCLVQSGSIYTDTLYKLVTGQALEILLLQNPYTIKPGNTVQAKILFRGAPLTGKLITARQRNGNDSPTVQTMRTNDRGICSFAVKKKGEWFIHATHMIPCPDKTDSDWESFWASYSFGID